MRADERAALLSSTSPSYSESQRAGHAVRFLPTSSLRMHVVWTDTLTKRASADVRLDSVRFIQLHTVTAALQEVRRLRDSAQAATSEGHCAGMQLPLVPFLLVSALLEELRQRTQGFNSSACSVPRPMQTAASQSVLLPAGPTIDVRTCVHSRVMAALVLA
jgi:hypothetical protein